jgi:microcystin-dependent protein
VNGRIEDETGFVMPVGSIIPWAGPAPNPPKGWLVCDGKEISKAVYSDLFQVIGTNWGEGSGSDAAEKFKVPELRGWFLRGWSGDANYDPEKNARFNINNSQQQIGNVVGSYQNDALQGHRHEVKYDGENISRGVTASGGPGARMFPTPTTDVKLYAENLVALSPYGAPRFTSETRPGNAAVLYIIKY